MIILTRHGIRRMHQRMGLPKRAVLRTAGIALRYGVEIEQERQMTGLGDGESILALWSASCDALRRVLPYIPQRGRS